MAQAILLAGRRVARRARPADRRRPRLPAQLPDPPQAGPAGDGGGAGGGPAPPRGRRKGREARAEREAEAAGLLSKTVLTIHQRAGEDGKLFGSVGPKEIVDALRDARDLRIDKRKVRLDQPLRELGTFMVEIELADGTVAAVKTIISEEK